MGKSGNTIECQVCKKPHRLGGMIPGRLVEKPLRDFISQENPQWSPDSYICLGDLNHFRTRYVSEVLETARAEVDDLEKHVAQSLAEEELLSRNLNKEFAQQLTRGERLADRLADFGGSWSFISIFLIVLVSWMAVNSWLLLTGAFDPYPYILLNLVLSCLAAIQAPVILMSQNRQEARDRLRADHDYLINLKAEIEIRKLHEKVDHLLMHQWQRLMDIQQVQVSLMEEFSRLRTKIKTQAPETAPGG